MKTKNILTLACAALFVASAASAHPRHYAHTHGHVVRAPGVVVAPAPRPARPLSYNCAVNGCSGTVTTTGPHGNTVTRSGSAGCADGTCSRSKNLTGPAGNSRTLTRTISR